MGKGTKSITVGSLKGNSFGKEIKYNRDSVVINGKPYSKDKNSSKYYLEYATAKLRGKNLTSVGPPGKSAGKGNSLLNASTAFMDGINCTVDMSKKKSFSLEGSNADIELENTNIDNEKQWKNMKNSKQSIADRFPNPNDPIYKTDKPRSQAEQNRLDDAKQTRKNIRTLTLAADLARVNLDPAYNTELKYFKNT